MNSPLKIYNTRESDHLSFVDIALPEFVKDLCYDFAIKVTDTTFHKYKERSPFASRKKLIEYHYSGKLAEFAVAEFLIKYSGFTTTIPDTKIYPIGAKSYEADLSVTGKSKQVYSVHVKNQPLKFNRQKADDFDWLVQYNEPFIKSPKENELMVFTFMNADESVGLYKIASAKDVQFDEPYGSVMNKLRINGYMLHYFTQSFNDYTA